MKRGGQWMQSIRPQPLGVALLVLVLFALACRAPSQAIWYRLESGQGCCVMAGGCVVLDLEESRSAKGLPFRWGTRRIRVVVDSSRLEPTARYSIPGPHAVAALSRSEAGLPTAVVGDLLVMTSDEEHQFVHLRLEDVRLSRGGYAFLRVEPAPPCPRQLQDVGTRLLCEPSRRAVDEVAELRMQGELAPALARAEARVACAEVPETEAVELWLEMARVHDRFGLHENRRPVVEALEAIEAAARLASEAVSRARVELGLADYHYRAEMSERRFPKATEHAQAAIEAFATLGDYHGEADAVHKLGLIHLQKRELDRARELFDQSLELDRAGGERSWFCGEYERHVAFVYLRQDQAEQALPHLRRSLECRREAGAGDAAMYAALTLGSTLTRLGQPAEARDLAEWALSSAERIDSPRVRAQGGLTLGRALEELGDRAGARAAYEAARAAAEEVALNSIAEAAIVALENLSDSAAGD